LWQGYRAGFSRPKRQRKRIAILAGAGSMYLPEVIRRQGTHSMRRTQVTQIHWTKGNLHSVHLTSVWKAAQSPDQTEGEVEGQANGRSRRPKVIAAETKRSSSNP
jgi:hypothetical protein